MAPGEDSEPGTPAKDNQEETQGEQSGQVTQPHSPAYPLVPLHILEGQKSQTDTLCLKRYSGVNVNNGNTV